VDSSDIARAVSRGRASRPAPVWLDSAQHVEALLNAAGELDGEAKSNGKVPRRAILSTLVFSGLRIGELIELRWRAVNLADGKLTVRTSKTAAGVRRVDLLPVLSDVLGTHKASWGGRPDDRVFPDARAAGRSTTTSRFSSCRW